MGKPSLQKLIADAVWQHAAPQKGVAPTGGPPAPWDQIANRDHKDRQMVRTVCIGGPLDGQMVSKNSTYFNFANPNGERDFNFSISDGPYPPMMEHVTYSIREFKTEEGILGFYVMEGISDFAALKMLLNNYMLDDSRGSVEQRNRELREAELARREAETKSLIQELAEADQ